MNARLTGLDRAAVAEQLATRYRAGDTIRGIAQATGVRRWPRFNHRT